MACVCGPVPARPRAAARGAILKLAVLRDQVWEEEWASSWVGYKLVVGHILALPHPEQAYPS